MPRDKTASHERVLAAAMDEFLEKGFEAASLSDIAKKAGLTTPALYRHATDKLALFSELVQPALEASRAWMERHQQDWMSGEEQWNPEALWRSSTAIFFMREVVLAHRPEFKLIVCRSAGTPYSTFTHDMVMGEQRGTLAFIETLRASRLDVRPVDPDELHLLLTGYVEAMFEIVRHDYDDERAQRYLDTLQQFYIPSWRAFFGF